MLLMIPALYGFGQYNKYIIRFIDKYNSPYSLSNPSAYLSQKAIDRRTRYSIAFDSSDLPVNPSYVQQVLAQGKVSLLSTSKWLNQLLVYCPDPATMEAIGKLAFVTKSQAVGNIAAGTVLPTYERFEEQVETLSGAANVQSSMEDNFNYGSSYDQVNMHNGEFLHNKNFTGSGITIAVLDAGFYHYKTLSAFDSMRLNGQVLGERDFVDFDNSVDEDNSHGMYCLSIIGANVPGVMVGTAPKANFWLLRSENVNSEYPIEEHNWVVAAEFADSAGADMITSSLGYYVFDDPSVNHSYDDFYANTTMSSQGAAKAAAKGMIVTNSAGNEGNNSWHYIIFPADADSICTVGAVNSTGQIAPFSSYGYPGRLKPNVVSVGSGTTVFGTTNVPVTGSGTSFSNPNLNGLIACLWQAFPQYNNMTILDAVYKGAGGYSHPDDVYGYGIPDMKAAYLILKKKQNIELYGTDWLFASPNPFSNKIQLKLIGQVDGMAQLSLLDKNGSYIRTYTLSTEQQEVYDTAFNALDLYPAGDYTVLYKDSLTQRSITLRKTGIYLRDWITVYPVPFSNQLSVYLKSPESGKVSIRLTDGLGRVIEKIEVDLAKDSYYQFKFRSAGALSRGIYFVQYSGQQEKTIKVLK